MPELPEVETVCRGLKQTLNGKTIEVVKLRRKDLRFPFPKGLSARLEGAAIHDILRRSKYLLWRLDTGDTLIAHLGMSGRFSYAAEAPKTYDKHDHVVLYFTSGDALIYSDPRRFGIMDICATTEENRHPLLVGLGPEPFSKSFNAGYLMQQLAQRKQPVKAALMDARLVVGVGNIYASEACFEAKIHPLQPGREAAKSADSLVKAIRKVLKAAIDSGGSSLKDFWHIDGGGGYFQHHFNVYGRAGKPCNRCGISIESQIVAGRNTFYCPQCQAVS